MQSLWLEMPKPGHLLLRGLTLAHTHLYSGLARGLAVDLGRPSGLPDILAKLWWRLDAAHDEATLRASAEVALLEALACGVTTVIDHHESSSFIDGSLDVLAEAARSIGVRLITCYGTSDRHGRAKARAGLRENERFAQAVGGDRLVHAMVGLHACFTVGDATLQEHVALARAHGLGLHLHLGEDKVDAGATDRLQQAGALDAKTVAAHAVHVTAAQRLALRDAGVTVVHNPRSNQNNAVGYARLGDVAGVVALGTDGIDGDVWHELRAAYFGQHAAYGAAHAVDVMAWLHRGLAVAQAQGADLSGDSVRFAYDPPTPISAANVASHLVFGVGARHVREVRVAGEVVWRDGQSTRVDAPAIHAKARHQARRLWEKLASE